MSTTTEQPTDTGRRRKLLTGLAANVGLIAYFAFSLMPVVFILALSFKADADQTTTYLLFDPTLDNYKTVLGFDDGGSSYLRFFMASLITSVGAVVVSLVIGIPAAYAAARYRFRGSDNLMFTLLSFRFAPELLVIIPLAVLYQQLGLYDTWVGMIWVLQLVTMPLVVWILRSFFQDFPAELEEAALLDGYSRTRAFAKHVLPLVRPGIAAVSLLAFIFAWNNFIFPFTLTSSNAQTVTVSSLAYLGGNQVRFNLVAAGAVMAALPPLVLALLIQRYLVRGLSFGAVKG
ncbi:carbohydrate ABC transporter permease [Stackebrandtia nassauensis]|uniref:Binding-protein-dependent transport systems inner membrane component n=1 Tax=Stackebrandtia nassauensis (strain DSM 44728 / CIP 108903 / NRRL B-16338 / NBRC 102104 / LLR-40K-21) TaxID=446470 RepID=D3Q0X8_STANL|nr:carbohydrate ABC transporter permease [Stackebrandtia nassauensis]ADD43728.1 binding-protein-dependent transport systems inner membrane component [Stackebrandtia nassauensis DSM 44728]